MLGEENKEQLVRGCETSPQQKNDQSQDFGAHVVRDAHVVRAAGVLYLSDNAAKQMNPKLRRTSNGPMSMQLWSTEHA